MKLKFSQVAGVEPETDIEIVQWLKKEGEAVSKGELLVEGMAVKTSIELESPIDGVLVKILCQENEIVTPEDDIAVVE